MFGSLSTPPLRLRRYAPLDPKAAYNLRPPPLQNKRPFFNTTQLLHLSTSIGVSRGTFDPQVEEGKSKKRREVAVT